MKWLVLAVLILAQQPAKAPEGQGTPKSVVTQDTQQANTSEENKKITTPAQTVYIQQINSPYPKQNAAETTDDMKIQGRIELFTGLLVIVGFVQAGVMLLQWCIYRRQAREMRRQRFVLNGQRHLMWRQWKAMGVQAGHMEGQLAQMSAQSRILQNSIELVINKERARIKIEKPHPLILPARIAMKVEFRLSFYGATPAFNVTSEVITSLSESRDSLDEGVFRHGIYELPTVITADSLSGGFHDFLLKPLPLDEPTVERIRNGQAHVHFTGRIKYFDFFDKPRETAFHYRWNPADNSPNSLRRLAFPEGWAEVGGDKENYAT